MAETLYTEQVMEWCQAMPAAVLEYPFGPDAAVFKVGGKMFSLVAIDGPKYITLKVDPDEGVALRAEYEAIREGYYMNKRHWVTVDLGPAMPMSEVEELIESSYLLVVSALTKKLRRELGLPAE